MFQFHNRPAWKIESEQIRVSVMQCGAHVAESTWKQSEVNPLWVQDRPTIDSDQFDPSIHGAMYRTDSEAKLICGLLGHNLCLPWWGYPSESEFASGMVCHGETGVVRWRLKLQEPDRLTIETVLPESHLRVQRSLRCIGSLVQFETTVENLTACDKPLAWCEHATFGPPFLKAGKTGFFAAAQLVLRPAMKQKTHSSGPKDGDRSPVI